MDAIGINLPGLVTQLVSFLILFFILSKLLYGPISKALDERSTRIKESLEAAERAQQDAASSAERVEQEIAEARTNRSAPWSTTRRRAGSSR